jgi:hypothetical protein
MEQIDPQTGVGKSILELDPNDGWSYDSASVVGKDLTIYVCLSDSLTTGHL